MSDRKDDRLKRNAEVDPAREPREMQNRTVTENREMTDDERLALFQSSFFDAQLPDIPKIPGYHVCWCTTTNPRDSISGRIRLGYEFVKPSDIPTFNTDSMKTAEYPGAVATAEMVAMKIPTRLYRKYMEEVHHNRPAAEQKRLADTADTIRAMASKEGAKDDTVISEDDVNFKALRANTPEARFAVD